MVQPPPAPVPCSGSPSPCRDWAALAAGSCPVPTSKNLPGESGSGTVCTPSLLCQGHHSPGGTWRDVGLSPARPGELGAWGRCPPGG